MNIKQLLNNKIKELFPELTVDLIFETPPNSQLGDLAIPCFVLAKELKNSPVAIAAQIAEKITTDEIIAKVAAQGPYINVFFQPKYLFQTVCKEISEQKEHYGDSAIGLNQKILVEYSGPNTNKPLHLGHARNNVLGMAVNNILTSAGFKVIKANLINDRGVHINKSMLAYQKWGYGKTPQTEHKKSDHFVGDYYVIYSQMIKDYPELETENKELLLKWEAGDKKVLALWKKMNRWAINGLNQTYKRMGCKFDIVYYESETYREGKQIVLQGLKDKIFFREDNGAIAIDLTDKKLDKKILLRADGTSLYMTQDLASSKRKFDQYHPDKAVWVVASEQEHHFKVLFEVLAKLKIADPQNLFHLSYGLVNLTTGKMKSREGTVVDIDNLMDDLEKLAREEIVKREAELPAKELAHRAKVISLGALKYYLVKAHPQKLIVFDPAESIAFDGNTGPYIQYVFARIQSIKNKSQKKLAINKIDFSLLGNEEERVIINLLRQFPEVTQIAAINYDPSPIANLVYNLAQAFNHFYHQHSVLAAENEALIQARLKLSDCVGIVIKKSLHLLGIETLDRM